MLACSEISPVHESVPSTAEKRAVLHNIVERLRDRIDVPDHRLEWELLCSAAFNPLFNHGKGEQRAAQTLE
jgi:hypothetical protein